MFAPIASELPDEWADVPRADASVAFGWQGILRHLTAGERVIPASPDHRRFLERSDIVAVSRHDIPSDWICAGSGLAGASLEADLLLTAGLLGGMLIHFVDGQITRARAYPSVPSVAEVDPAGAGDTMLAGLVAARIVAAQAGEDLGRDLRLGATASSLLVEGPGMNSVPTFAQMFMRLKGKG